MRMMPNEDNFCAFSRVTGEEPMVPRVVVQRWTSSEVIKELKNLSFAYKPTRSRHIPAHLPENLWTCEEAWLRLDRIHRPREAPYQGPFNVLARDKLNMTLEILSLIHI